MSGYFGRRKGKHGKVFIASGVEVRTMMCDASGQMTKGARTMIRASRLSQTL
jgi:hypothetical protein